MFGYRVSGLPHCGIAARRGSLGWGRGLPVVVVLMLSATTGCVSEPARRPAAVYPSLFYEPSDRAVLLKAATGDSGAAAWVPGRWPYRNGMSAIASYVRWKWSSQDGSEEAVAGHGSYESNRAALLFRKAMLLWLNPALTRPPQLVRDPTLGTYADLVRRAIDNICGPEGLTRSGANILLDGHASPWGQILGAGLALADYANAIDILLAPEVRAAVGDAAINELYRRLADGIFHILALHLRRYETYPAGAWNNWDAIEFSGTGLLAIALREFFEAEPSDSPRRADYAYVSTHVPEFMNRFLMTQDRPGDESYYYEGPHYTAYWETPALAYVRAFLRVDGPSKTVPALSFDASEPLVKLAKGQAALLVPIGIKKGVAEWSNIDFDDSWYGEIGQIQVRLAAWTRDTDPALAAYFENIAAYVGKQSDDLTLASPVEAEIRQREGRLRALPTAEELTNGVAVARTGSSSRGLDLSVALKNSETRPYSKALPWAPALDNHAHGDSGDVAIYRDGEPVALVPGYGEGGANGKNRLTLYASWLHQNVIRIAEPGRSYPADVLSQLGEAAGSDPFVMPLHPAGSDLRTRCAERADGLGRYWVLSSRMATPAAGESVDRDVAMDDSRRYVLVVDRLSAPRRVCVQWNGNGWEGAGTAQLDAKGHSTTAVFTGGAADQTRFEVMTDSTMQVRGLDGKFNPSWNDLKWPITCVHSISGGAVRWAVTLVEIAGKGSDFTLSARVSEDADGRIQSIELLDREAPFLRFSIGKEGAIEREQVRGAAGLR